MNALERYYATMDGKLDGDPFELLAEDFTFEIDGKLSGGKREYMDLRADYKTAREIYPEGHTILSAGAVDGLEVVVGPTFVTAAAIDGEGRLTRSVVFHFAEPIELTDTV